MCDCAICVVFAERGSTEERRSQLVPRFWVQWWSLLFTMGRNRGGGGITLVLLKNNSSNSAFGIMI